MNPTTAKLRQAERRHLRQQMALRLIRERGRLGYSKQHLAHLTDISGETLRLYEKGVCGMNAEFLAKLGELGFDVQYIITARGAIAATPDGIVRPEEDPVRHLQRIHAGRPQRIREERKRLGLTQAQAAEQCGILRQQWIRYEKGLSHMSLEVLERFDAIGADGAYLLAAVREPLATEAAS